jgi:hypothetical protein
MTSACLCVFLFQREANEKSQTRIKIVVCYSVSISETRVTEPSLYSHTGIHSFTLHTFMNICHKHTITSYYENRKKWEGGRRLTDGLAYIHKYTSRTQHKTEVVFFLSLYANIFFSMPMTLD